MKLQKMSANYLQITWLSPFPAETVTAILSKCKRPIVVENAMLGQLKDLIHEKTGRAIKESILKYDGRPFFPEDIIERINSNGKQ